MKPVVIWQGVDYARGGGVETADQAKAARELGCRIVEMPRHLPDEAAVLEALADLAPEPVPTWALWVGFINYEAVYRAVHKRLLEANIVLINDPDAHLTVFELHRALPHLGDLTPATSVATTAEEAAAAAEAMGYPVFVKGALSSRKEMGWKHCVADTAEQVRTIAAGLLGAPMVSRGHVMVRELAPLIRREVGDRDFPAAREFRVFTYRGEVMGHGFYWGYLIDELTRLTADDERAMLDVAREAAARLPTPWVSLDVGQLEDGRWIIIEPGDPQFSGLSFIETDPLWAKLIARVEAETPPGA